jgi:ABC-type transport system substrate-binding protein
VVFSGRAIVTVLGLCLLGASCSSSNSAELTGPLPIQVEAGRPQGLPFEDVTFDEGAFRLALQKPATIDPAQVSLVDQSAVIVSDLVYDTLVEAVGTEGQLRPQLATSWEHTGNFSTWRFTVDINRVAPESVKASFERLVATAPDSAAVAMLDEVFGAADVRAGIDTRISGIQVVDEQTVEIKLVRPDAGFPWLLSGLNYSIVGPDAAPTGTYSVGVDNGETLLLSSGQHADIAITWTKDRAEAAQLLADDVVDGALVDEPTNPQARSIVRFFALNTLAADLVDIDTRRAVLAAIDSDSLLARTGSTLLPVDGAATSGLAGWQADACGLPCEFDPAIVQSQIAALGGTAPVLTIAFVGDNDAALAHAIADDLRAAGFGSEVVQYSADQLASSIAAGTSEIFAFGWPAPAHSVDSVVSAMFSSHSELNVARFAYSDVDELLAAASGLGDDTLRWALLQQAHSAALDQAVLLPIGSARNHLVINSTAHNFAVRADGSLEVNSDR